MKKNIIIILSVLLLAGAFTFILADVDYTEYKVKDGETFMEICEKVLLDCASNWKQLLKFNGLNKPTDVKPGMVLKIPNSLSKNRYAKVQFLDGDVNVYNPKTDAFEKIRANFVLVEGNILQTGDNSKCEIKLDDGTILKLDSDTVVALGKFNFKDSGSNTLLKLIEGSVLMKITKLGDGDAFNVETTSAVAGVRGTEFKVTTNGVGESAVVEINVLEGKVAAKPISGSETDEIVLSASKGQGDTTAEKIKKEGGSTSINSEKIIDIEEGYTLQFNWKQDQAFVTAVPGQITGVTIEETD